MGIEKKYKDFTRSQYVKDIAEAGKLMSVRGWAERNAGNISMIIPDAEAEKYFDPDRIIRSFRLDLDIRELAGKIFLITAAGTYFRKLRYNPAKGLGALRVSENGRNLDLLWGFEENSKPTSEMLMHFMGHIERLKRDHDHKVIMHTHATDIIVMSTISELDERAFTSALWRMHSECMAVFPDGIGLLPWIVPGTEIISAATADKFQEFRLVVWPLHGIIAAGSSIDDAMGLIETVEKSAGIYIKSRGASPYPRVLTDRQLMDIADHFKLVPREGIIEES